MIRGLMTALSMGLVVAACAIMSSESFAQQPGLSVSPRTTVRIEDAAVGSPQENSLLILNLLARDRTQTTLRPWSRRELTALADSSTPREAKPPLVRWSLPLVETWWNSSSPNHDRDGVVWQGKGATVAVSGGVSVAYGPLSMALRPIVFSTQNLAYRVLAPGPLVPGTFRDPFYGTSVDIPFRFGNKAYSRADWGESYVRLMYGPLALGWSNETQTWGPAHLYPLVMSSEAGGYEHVFLGTVKPVNFGIAHASARWELGRMEGSGFMDKLAGPARFAPALIVSVTPAGWDGLEFGGTRLFEAPWHRGVVSWYMATLPFAGFFKNSNPTKESDAVQYNQLASIFVRVAPPGAGVEAYTEFYREDASANVRDLVGEPDHESAFVIGMRRAWQSRKGVVRSVTMENANARKSHLQRLRDEPPFYLHFAILEGHTSRGQLLGSSVIPGGGGAAIVFDEIRDASASTIRVEQRRLYQSREGGSWEGVLTGEYEASVTHTKVRSRWSESWTVGLRHGYGLAKTDALMIATTYRPR